MGKSEKLVAAAGIVAALGGAIVTQIAPALFHDYLEAWFWGGIAAVLVGLVLFAWAVLRRDNAPVSAYKSAIDQSVTSHGQMGGVTAHTVHLRPEPRSLLQSDQRDMLWRLLEFVPRGRRIQVIAAAGDTETEKFAHEIQVYLKQLWQDVPDLQVRSYLAGNFVGLIPNPIEGGPWELIVGKAE